MYKGELLLGSLKKASSNQFKPFECKGSPGPFDWSCGTLVHQLTVQGHLTNIASMNEPSEESLSCVLNIKFSAKSSVVLKPIARGTFHSLIKFKHILQAKIILSVKQLRLKRGCLLLMNEDPKHTSKSTVNLLTLKDLPWP